MIGLLFCPGAVILFYGDDMILKLTVRPIRTAAIPFDETTHDFCPGCEKHAACWSCPPAIDAKAMITRLRARRDGWLFALDSAFADPRDLPGIWDENREYLLRLREKRPGSLAVGCGGCTACEACAYPSPCRAPEKLLFPMEAYCVDVAALAARTDLTMDAGAGRIRFFALLLR